MFNKIKEFFTTHNKIRKTFKFFFYLFAGIILLGLLTYGGLQVSCRPGSSSSSSNKEVSLLSVSDTRPEVSTYLTYPEWFIVYSSDEYAQYLEKNKPSGFPYFGSVNQYWSNYCRVYAITKAHGEFNAGDHFMLFVIGWSYSAELGIKGVYENTVGRVTESFGQYPSTAEDKYADQVDKDYVNFIRIRPWYEYNFFHALTGLWAETNFFGPNFVRKIERKLFLSLEYSVKTVYAGFIGAGSHSVYGVESVDTYVVVKNIKDLSFSKHPEVKKVKQLDNGQYEIIIPRYQPFTDIVPELSKEGVQFIDIAGNKEIFLTALVDRNLKFSLTKGQIIFETNILTNPKQKRIALSVPVESLGQVLQDLQSKFGFIEHIYDY